ncbi:MAG: hypothetical protein HY318_16850 [Armatimonadetes bacterium]|nr:hypothetical protein [Armatimonadota bacterium]
MVGNYRVVYDVRESAVSILTVFHARRNARALLSSLD